MTFVVILVFPGRDHNAFGQGFDNLEPSPLFLYCPFRVRLAMMAKEPSKAIEDQKIRGISI